MEDYTPEYIQRISREDYTPEYIQRISREESCAQVDKEKGINSNLNSEFYCS